MYHYWGKASKKDASYHLLVYHSLDVGAVLHYVLEADAPLHNRFQALVPAVAPRDLDALLLFFAVLHDLGKFAPVFQHYRSDIVTTLGGGPLLRHNDRHHTSLGWLIFNKYVFPDWRQGLPAAAPSQLLRTIRPLTEAAFGHHGKPPQQGQINLYLSPAEIEAIRRFAREAGRLLLPPDLALPGGDEAENVFKPVSWLFAGLLVLSDWIASGQNFAYVAEEMPLATYWRDHALPQARAAVADCGILVPPPRHQGGFHDLLPHLDKDAAPTPLQALAMEKAGQGVGPRLFIFEDVTGAGKTEAALLAAHGLMTAGAAEGFAIGLPTMATANGMYARLADSYRALFDDTGPSAPSLMLAHGARGIHDAFLRSIGLEQGQDSDGEANEAEDRDSGAYCASWLADNRKKALLAPCGVGTLDQALLAVLPTKHQCLRLLGLGRNVLIADEVHAYDPYTTRLLEALLTFQAGLGGSAILLSATLPQRIKQHLAEAFCQGAGYAPPRVTDAPLPLATRIAGDVFEEIELPATRTLSIAVELTDDPGEAVSRLLAVHAAGGCAIYICNTVDRAVAAQSFLSEQLPAGDVLLFHARFALCDRLDIEARVLSIFGKGTSPEVRRGKILVASQVVEQSIDIDGDFIITELAPMELLLQRAGRCQRHKRAWRPDGFPAPAMLVLSPRATDDAGPGWGEAVLGKGLFVYPAHGLLWRTARLLEGRPDIELPKDARTLVENAYDEETFPTPEGLVAAEDKAKGKDCAENSLAQVNVLDFFQGYGADAALGGWYDDRITPTRLGEPTVTLRLVKATGDSGALELWAGPERDAQTCARSEVSVSLRRATGLIEPDIAWKERLDTYTQTLPDKGRFVSLVPLVETATKGLWRCALPGTALTYSCEKGLCFEKITNKNI